MDWLIKKEEETGKRLYCEAVGHFLCEWNICGEEDIDVYACKFRRQVEGKLHVSKNHFTSGGVARTGNGTQVQRRGGGP